MVSLLQNSERRGKMSLKDIKGMSLDELETFIISLKQPKFRGKQIYEWLHQKLVEDFTQMTNLPKSLIEQLQIETHFTTLKVVSVLTSSKDSTQKFLFQCSDGERIETVSMHYDHGHSVCISTQVGCRMGCTFCASGIGGLKRQLTASEMLEQVYAVERIVKVRVSHVVLMGTGEPLDNYDEVLKFIRLITSEKGKNLSVRHMTLSTCGLVPQIRQLAQEDLGINLAISLHAPDDVLRQETMPIAKAFNMKELMKACEYYFTVTKRRITFEYSLIQDVNDSQAQGIALAKLLKSYTFKSHVNLIPINPVKEKNYKSTERQNIYQFQKILADHGVEATVRRSLGTDIDAACGQLRRQFEEELCDRLE